LSRSATHDVDAEPAGHDPNALPPASGRDRSDPPSKPRGERTQLLIAGALLLALLVAGGAWALLDGDGDGGTAGDASTTTEGASKNESPDTAAGPIDSAPDGAETTTPAPETVGRAAAPPPALDPVAPCTADEAELLGVLRAYPPLASFAAELEVGDVKCVGRWATAVVTTPETDSALAVYEQAGDGFTLLLVGSAEPCAGLGIPAESEPLLGCDFG